MKLVVSNQRFELGVRISPLIKKVKAFLDKTKPGTLFHNEQIAGAVGCNISSLRTNDNPAFLRDYYAVVRQKKYWGSVKTIRELRRQEDAQHKRSRRKAEQE